MQLEIKHLAPYLPFGVKVRVLREDNEYDIFGLTPSQLTLFASNYHFEFKPILRPISDLNKQVEIEGKLITPIEMVLPYVADIPPFLLEDERERLMLRLRLGMIDGIFYAQIQRLLQMHFDIFGLIKEELALDINHI